MINDLTDNDLIDDDSLIDELNKDIDVYHFLMISYDLNMYNSYYSIKDSLRYELMVFVVRLFYIDWVIYRLKLPDKYLHLLDLDVHRTLNYDAFQ